VLAALAAGVPLLIVSKGAPSQTRMAAACAAAGVAVLSDQDPGSIAAAIARVLDADGFRKRAHEVARDIRGMPAPPVSFRFWSRSPNELDCQSQFTEVHSGRSADSVGR